MTDDLVRRLRGEYRVPITDGLGAVGSGSETDNPCQYVRHFETAQIQHEAAARIEELERHVELRDFFLTENDLWEKFAKGEGGK